MLQPSNTNLQNVLKQNTSIKINAGCTIEYNMNMLTNLTESSVTGPSYKTFDNGRQPFKKLFPLDSIIQSFRPAKAGVKYAIFGDMAQGDYRNPATTEYLPNYRVYYPGLDTYYKYWVSNIGQGGTITISYPKTIVANKIVVKFEISHATPPTWSVYGTPAGGSEGLLTNGTNSSIPSFSSGNNDSGVLTIYYTGSTWTTNAALHNTDAYVSLSSVKLTFGGVSNKFIGIIEFAPIWVKDISSEVVNLNIVKNSSSDEEGIIPINLVTSNSLSINLNKFNESTMQILSYEKSNSYAIDPTKIYLYKQIVFKPYFKIYHSNGAYGSGSNKYDKIEQGYFYVDNWETSEYDEVSVTALDAAKILQDTLAPPILCENYSAIAILRRLLDSIGFTNYKFNIATNDKSVISPNYWWTNDSNTVWQSIQELCRDTQIMANVDENNILQFYTRDYLYSNRSSVWQFNSETNNNILPNISSLTKNDLASANQIKIIWRSAVTSNYLQNADIIWKSDNTYLAAAALVSDLNSSDVSTYDSNGDVLTPKYISLQPITTNEYQNQQSFYSFTGYFIIEDEIIEYDAIQYQVELATGTTYNSVNYSAGDIVNVDISSSTDVFKYRGLAKPDAKSFQPNGKYRIKERGKFGSGPSENSGYPHRSGTDSQLNSWTVKEVQLNG